MCWTNSACATGYMRWCPATTPGCSPPAAPRAQTAKFSHDSYHRSLLRAASSSGLLHITSRILRARTAEPTAAAARQHLRRRPGWPIRHTQRGRSGGSARSRVPTDLALRVAAWLPRAAGQAPPGGLPRVDGLALPGAVPCARLHTRHVLWEWGLTALRDDTELLVSELVTNAVHASRSMEWTFPVRMRLLSDRAQVAIVVWDANPQPPVRTEAGEDDETGRGLILVDAISERWDWNATPDRSEE